MLDFRTNTFLTVCETMNFTEAARQLHITQPAVSQHIRFLEKKYDTQLFLYHNKQLHLTQTGKILKKRLMTMKNDQFAILEEIKSASYQMESLSIGVTMTIGEYVVASRIEDFLKHHPDMNLHIHYGNTSELLELLDRGEISLALVEGNYPKENYGHKNFSTEDYIGVCSAEHKFQKENPKNMNDLKQERLLV